MLETRRVVTSFNDDLQRILQQLLLINNEMSLIFSTSDDIVSNSLRFVHQTSYQLQQNSDNYHRCRKDIIAYVNNDCNSGDNVLIERNVMQSILNNLECIEKPFVGHEDLCADDEEFRIYVGRLHDLHASVKAFMETVNGIHEDRALRCLNCYAILSQIEVYCEPYCSSSISDISATLQERLDSVETEMRILSETPDCFIVFNTNEALYMRMSTLTSKLSAVQHLLQSAIRDSEENRRYLAENTPSCSELIFCKYLRCAYDIRVKTLEYAQETSGDRTSAQNLCNSQRRLIIQLLDAFRREDEGYNIATENIIVATLWKPTKLQWYRNMYRDEGPIKTHTHAHTHTQKTHTHTHTRARKRLEDIEEPVQATQELDQRS